MPRLTKYPWRNARDLLLSLMTPEQRQDFVAMGAFDVVGSEGNYYRISHGYQGNVYVLPDGPYLCAHPPFVTGAFEGVMMVQMLAIEADEIEFRRVAMQA